MKAKHPLEYYSTVLNIYQKSTETTSKITKELSHFDIKVKPISFGNSKAFYSPSKEDNSIYKGIASIKFLNIQIADELNELSKNEYDRNDWVTFLLDIIHETSVDARQMETLIRMDFFKEFGVKEALLEIYLTMIARKRKDGKPKKANFDLYPEFADKMVKIPKEKKDRKTKEVTITYENKIVKTPLKYDKKLKEKGKKERLENLAKYEKAVRANPPRKIELYEQLQFEKDTLGYTVSVWEGLDEDIYCVTDILNLQYTPKLVLYQVSTGNELTMKVNKNKFWKYDETQLFYIGDVLRIIKTHEEDAWKMSNNEWERNPDIQETHLDKAKIIRSSPERNKIATEV